jgi:ATP-dependent Clp protease ATP-binding subunit ClpC
MFERFTDRARQAVIYAQEEARHLNHTWIGDGLAAQMLVSRAIDLNLARQQIIQLLSTRPGDMPPPGD